jgi:hypothetical protein
MRLRAGPRSGLRPSATAAARLAGPRAAWASRWGSGPGWGTPGRAGAAGAGASPRQRGRGAPRRRRRARPRPHAARGTAPPPPRPRRRRRTPLPRPVGAAATEAFTWTGSDEFTPLGDRVDAPPLPLPPIAARRRVVLVRHGQSTWNAEGRIQGSSDWSRLTDKGVAQAETTRDMVPGGGGCKGQPAGGGSAWRRRPRPRHPPRPHPHPHPHQIKDETFDSLFVSPLTRARQTADIVARGTGLEAKVLPSLREIDLYSFQVGGWGG